MVASGKSELGWFNPFSTNIPLLYPLKTSETLRFSDVFMGYKNRTLVENGLNTDFVQVFGWHWRKLEEAEATIHRSFIKNLFSWKISKFCVFLKKAGCSFIKKDTPTQVFFLYLSETFLLSRGYEKIYQTKFTWKRLWWSFFIKVADLQLTANLDWPRYMYSLGFSEIFQNIWFTEKIPVAIGVF